MSSELAATTTFETPAPTEPQAAFRSILDGFRREAYSEREKGARFERLMRDYLMTAPRYAGQFKTVWLWNDFPYRAALGGQDTGIDIVALTAEGAYWAVQCKCYQESAVIDKVEVDGFLSTAGRSFMDESGQTRKFDHCLWISTTNHWGRNAEETIQNHIPAVSRLSLRHLETSPVDWAKLAWGLYGENSRTPKHAPLPHQNDAIAAAARHFASADRGQLIMACGTGKTFTALRIAEQQAEKTVLFLVPSIALLSQTLGEWLAHAKRPIHPVCVCSDPEVSRRKKKMKIREA
jgi:predicted helicase